MPPKAKKAVAPPPSTLGALRDQLGKKYGTRLSRREAVRPYDILSTGSMTLDLAMRTGGYVVGRIHELVGAEGSSKTTLAIYAMIEAQLKYPDRVVTYIDMEQTFDYDWAEALGLLTDDDHFIHLYPENSEDVSDMVYDTSRGGLSSIVTVDSIGGMESNQAFEKEAAEVVMGRNAQVITRMVKRSAVNFHKHKVVGLFINQYRANISNPMGSDIAAGPKALKYSTTMQVQMSRTAEAPLRIKVDDEEETIALQFRARVSRSKVAAQGRKAEYWLFNQATPQFGPIGIDRFDEAVTIGQKMGIIEQKGSWLTLPGHKKPIQGRDGVKDYLREHPDEMAEIRRIALDQVRGDVIPDVEINFDPETGEVLENVEASA